LEQLIADLLTVSSLETGSDAVLEKAPVNVAAVAEGVTISMLPITSGRSQRLTVNVDEASAVVLGDVRQLEHVMTNLLTNASKFTPAGGEITVDVRQADDHVAIAVRDTGIGIPPEELSKVFSRFYRGSDPLVAQVPGTGLGLSIVHGIVRHHGGKVSIESEVGVGTTVEVALPPGLPSPFHAMASD
jgi:signal transduction histidine kinase